MNRICRKCGQPFEMVKTRYKRRVCPRCAYLYHRAYIASIPDYWKKLYAKDPEKNRARVRKQNRDNPTKARERAKRYRLANPEKTNAIWHRWYQKNRKRAIAGVKRWQAKNPDKTRRYVTKCQLRKRRELSDSYLKSVMRRYGMTVTPESIIAYRAHVKSTRLKKSVLAARNTLGMIGAVSRMKQHGA